MSLETKIFFTLILPTKKRVYISILTMPEKLPRRSAFLPSLSIKIVAINDPRGV
jgi:hypothetical protein